MGFLKSAVKLAKAVDRANRVAARENARQERYLAKRLRDEERELKRQEKSETKQRKMEAKEEKELRGHLREKYETVHVRLRIDEEFDWLEPHIL